MYEIQINSSRHANRRADWALKTTLIMLEKSLMVWLRLGIWLIVFGFTVFKLLLGLVERGTVLMRPEVPRNVGVFLILLGLFLLGVGIRDYRNSEKMLLGGLKHLYSAPFALAATYVFFLTGLFLLLNIFFGIGDL
ncbi:MAG TPA: DUF202 domain-containing protein [Pyrinomonadaceae bacterium]|jgi:uncharacterized membrane protein YidH (DUF202 family)